MYPPAGHLFAFRPSDSLAVRKEETQSAGGAAKTGRRGDPWTVDSNACLAPQGFSPLPVYSAFDLWNNNRRSPLFFGCAFSFSMMRVALINSRMPRRAAEIPAA